MTDRQMFNKKWVLVEIFETGGRKIKELKGIAIDVKTYNSRAGLSDTYFDLVNKKGEKINLNYGMFSHKVIKRLLTEKEILEDEE